MGWGQERMEASLQLGEHTPPHVCRQNVTGRLQNGLSLVRLLHSFSRGGVEAAIGCWIRRKGL